MEAEVGSKGAIKFVGKKVINGKKQVIEKIMVDENQKNKKIFKRKMVNYCSMGIDARIGLGFDKRRTSSRSCNKMVYAFEGLKNFWCTKQLKVKSFVKKMEFLVGVDHKKTLTTQGNISKELALPPSLNESMRIKEEVLSNYNIEHDEDSKLDSLEDFEQKEIGDYQVTTKTIFRTGPAQLDPEGTALSNQDAQNLLPKNSGYKGNGMTQPQNIKKFTPKGSTRKVIQVDPCTIIALNIDSYASGIRKMWDKSKLNTPVEKKSNKGLNLPQKFDDGKVEFLGYKSGFYLGVCERLCPGGGHRIAQGNDLLILLI